MEDEFIEQDQDGGVLRQQPVHGRFLGACGSSVDRAEGIARARAAELEGEFGRKAAGVLIAMMGEYRVTGPSASTPTTRTSDGLPAGVSRCAPIVGSAMFLARGHNDIKAWVLAPPKPVDSRKNRPASAGLASGPNTRWHKPGSASVGYVFRKKRVGSRYTAGPSSRISRPKLAAKIASFSSPWSTSSRGVQPALTDIPTVSLNRALFIATRLTNSIDDAPRVVESAFLASRRCASADTGVHDHPVCIRRATADTSSDSSR
jgi:hypothetical protein